MLLDSAKTALAFARECLEWPDAHIAPGVYPPRIRNARGTSFCFTDLPEVMAAVSRYADQIGLIVHIEYVGNCSPERPLEWEVFLEPTRGIQTPDGFIGEIYDIPVMLMKVCQLHEDLRQCRLNSGRKPSDSQGNA